MHKIICVLLYLLIMGCDSAGGSFKGKEFILINAYPDSEITIGFAENENRFFGKAVNRYFGTYAADNGRMTLGQVGSTLMMGPPRQMRDEADFFALLPAVRTYRMEGGTLILTLGDGQEWIFKPRPPHAR